MRTDKVLTKNRKLAIVAAVAVAICLLFAYLTLDSEETERRAEAVGDHVHTGVWSEDGVYHDIEYILASVDGEESVYIKNVYGVGTSTITTVNGFLEDLCYFDPEGLERAIRIQAHRIRYNRIRLSCSSDCNRCHLTDSVIRICLVILLINISCHSHDRF